MSRCSRSTFVMTKNNSSIATASAIAASSSTSTTDSSNIPNGGHCASPYLRRFRLPKLNTIRRIDIENDSDDDDEWCEIQMAKNDLIKFRMQELKNRYEETKINNKNNNTNNSSSKNSRQQRNITSSEEVQTTSQYLFFHPKQLFNNTAALGPSDQTSS